MKHLLAVISFLFLGVSAIAQMPAAPMPAGPIPPVECDQYGGITALKEKATGWFHVAKLGEHWFFITPDGHALFSLGVTHTAETVRNDELGLYRTRYEGSAEKLSEFYLKHLRDWGYNSAGYGTLGPLEKKLPYVASIMTEGPISTTQSFAKANSDIFDPKVQERMRAKVRKAAHEHRENPFCLGYVFMDVPIWTVRPKSGPSYVEFFRALPATAPGHIAVAKFTAANPKADDQAVLDHIADHYYSILCTELRKEAPKQLILGDRFIIRQVNPATHTPDSILKVAARHVDVLSFQPNGTGQPVGQYLDSVHQLTGKPLLLADVNTMTMRPEKEATDTKQYETEAAARTRSYYLAAAASPGCIGIHRCTIRDYQPWNTEIHRRGLLKADDTPYPILTAETRKINQEVLDKVYAKAAR